VIVVDASVAAKWFLAEEDSPLANALLRGRDKLAGPDLLRIEVHAAITRRFRNGEAPEADVRRGCQDWLDLLGEGLITLFPSAQDDAAALDLAVQLKHPFQDCLYLALAQRLQAPLVTADPKFLGKAVPLYPQVRPLRGPAT
jgi:predicted nucleic acid-binding protein